VKRLSAGDIQLVAAVTAAGGEHVHITLTTRAGPHAAFKKVIFRTLAKNPKAFAHADKRYPVTRSAQN
jgi:hypothetical protein